MSGDVVRGYDTRIVDCKVQATILVRQLCLSGWHGNKFKFPYRLRLLKLRKKIRAVVCPMAIPDYLKSEIL